jgi:hypothetical protein
VSIIFESNAILIAILTPVGLLFQGSLTDYFRDPITKVEHSLNLDPEENFLVLSFSYVLEYDKYSRLKQDYKKFKDKFDINLKVDS